MHADCAFDSRWHTNNCPYFIRVAVTTYPYVLNLSLQKTQSLNLWELRKKRVREKGLNGFLEHVKMKIRQTYQSCEGSCWRIRSRRPGRTAGGWGRCDTPSERCDTDPADPQRPGLTAWSRPSPSCHGMAAGFCNTVTLRHKTTYCRHLKCTSQNSCRYLRPSITSHNSCWHLHPSITSQNSWRHLHHMIDVTEQANDHGDQVRGTIKKIQ